MSSWIVLPLRRCCDYLDQGLTQGRSLGDGALRSAQNYFRGDSDSDAVILDLIVASDGEAVVDVVTGRESPSKSKIGFIELLMLLARLLLMVCATSLIIRSMPDGTSDRNRYDPLTGFSAKQTVAELDSGIEVDQRYGKLAPFAVANGQLFFTFPEANPDGLNHFRALATNIIGFEDSDAGDTDFDDAILAFRFANQA